MLLVLDIHREDISNTLTMAMIVSVDNLFTLGTNIRFEKAGIAPFKVEDNTLRTSFDQNIGVLFRREVYAHSKPLTKEEEKRTLDYLLSIGFFPLP